MNNAAIQALRAHVANRFCYPYTLKFTREFTSGTLVGMTHEDSLGFCQAADADEWVAAVNRQNKAGKVDYKVIKWTVGKAAV